MIPEAKTKRVKSWLNHDAFDEQSLRDQTHLHKSILPVTSRNLSSCTCFPLALKFVRTLHLFVNSFLAHTENSNRNTQTKLAYGTHATHIGRTKLNSPHLRLLCCILQLADALAESPSVALVATSCELCCQYAGTRTIRCTRDCKVFATFTNVVSRFQC